MTRLKHEHLIELMSDAFWSTASSARSLADAQRMGPVLQVIIDLLMAQPRAVDDDGSLQWAARWLEKRMREDAEQ
jgi:hypothetical protein